MGDSQSVCFQSVPNEHDPAVQVMELERTHRLQEIRARLDPRVEAKVRDGGLFRGGELLRRRLIHEGMLLWKTPGSRLKGVCVCVSVCMAEDGLFVMA